MEIIDEGEFKKNNDMVANKKIYHILILCAFVGPFIALGVKLNAFNTNYEFCILITLISVVELILDYIFCRCEKYYKIAKYFGMIAVNILLGFMASRFAIGVNISYILVPILSCMYLDSKYTAKVAVLGYFIMMIALYFRAYGAIAEVYTQYTHKRWFITQGLGFTLEYGIASIALYCLSKYLRMLIRNYYDVHIEKIQTIESNKVRNNFFNNVNVELQEPINKVILDSESLMQDESLDSKTHEKLRNISDTNKLILSKLKDLGDFSVMALEKNEIDQCVYKLSRLIEEIKEGMFNRIGSKSIDFNVLVNPSIPNELVGDEIRIRQVIINLLNDALKNIEDGFIILKVDWKKREDIALLTIDIMDTGYGKEDIEKRTNSNFAICKELCERMKAVISVTNDYDKGSGFTVTLPQKIVSGSIVYGDAIWKK